MVFATGFPCSNVFELCKAWRNPWASQLFACVFHGVLELHVVGIDEINAPSNAVFLYVEQLLTYLTKSLATKNWVWMLLEFFCERVVLGKGAKILISWSAQGICPPHRGI